MKLDFKIEGEAKLQEEFKKLLLSMPDAAGAALYQEGFSVCALAQDKCPVEYGRLAASAYVAPPTEEDGAATVEIGFGTAYAVVQHERTEFRHKVGEAKFLEKAVDTLRSGMLGRLAERTWQNFQRGVGARAIPAEKPTAPRV